jgi:hypothetical protein
MGAALLAGCGPDGPDLFRVEVVDGIPHSVAVDAPERGDASLELLWEAPSRDEIMDGAEWANPTQLTANDRLVAVLDPQLARVHVFTPDGDRAGSFGRRGGGPGEFTNPVALAVHGDTIMVRDPRRPAVQLFDRTGAYLGGFAEVEGLSFAFYHLDGVGVLRSSVVPRPGTTEQQLILIGYDGERRAITLPGDHPLQPHVREGDSGCWRRSAPGPHLVETDCSFPLIRVLDADGRILREHRIDRAPRATPEDQLDAMEAMMRRQMGQVGGNSAAPEFIQEMVDRSRNQNRWHSVMRMALATPSTDRLVLWEQISNDLGGGDGTLHLLDGEGRYLLRHEMGAPLRDVAVADRRIYVLMSDPATELKTLRAYRIP